MSNGRDLAPDTTRTVESTSPSRDPSKTRVAVWLPIIIAASVAIGGAIGWFYDKQSQRAAKEQERVEGLAKENQRLLNEYLVKIQVNLEKTKVISDELSESYLEPGWGILESYVIKARRDGHGKHALMYRRIARLVQSNAEIVSLLDNYTPYALTEDFRKQAAQFRDHAQRWIDRWEVVPEIVATGQQLPVAKVFPRDFPQAVQQEVDARKSYRPPAKTAQQHVRPNRWLASARRGRSA